MSFFIFSIEVAEGIIEEITVPEIDITNWKTVLQSLQKIGNSIIIEKESLDKDKCRFEIGKVIKVLEKKGLFMLFDAGGMRQDELWEIPFTEITSTAFSSRYIDSFSKYLIPNE